MLFEHTPMKWLKERPAAVLLSEIENNGLNPILTENTTNKLYRIAKILELRYNNISPKTLLPIHIKENLNALIICRSKTLINLNGLSEPGGGYKFINNILSQAQTNLPIPNTFGVVFIDNDQKLKKNYNLKVNSVAEMQMITSVTYINKKDDDESDTWRDFYPGNHIYQAWSVTKRAKLDTLFEQFENVSKKKRIDVINGTIVHSNSARSHFHILEDLKDYQKNAGKKICRSDGCDGIILTSEVTKCWRCGKGQLVILSEEQCRVAFFEKLPEKWKTSRYVIDKIVQPTSSSRLNDDSMSPGLPIFEPPNSWEACSVIMQELCQRFLVRESINKTHISYGPVRKRGYLGYLLKTKDILPYIVIKY